MADINSTLVIDLLDAPLIKGVKNTYISTPLYTRLVILIYSSQITDQTSMW